MKLQANKRRGKYKSTDAWLDAVYRKNKAKIDEALKGIDKPKSTFKNLVKEYMNEGKRPEKALKTVSNSTIFTPAAERLGSNAMKGLKADKLAYKQFREMTKERGRYTKFDRSKLRWDKYEKVYYYGDNIRISFKNSPKQVIIEEI